MKINPSSIVNQSVCILISMLLISTLGGCNIVAPALYLVKGLPKIPAQHKLDKERTTVVFIDDPTSALPRRTLRSSIAKRAEFELIQSKSLVNMVDANSIQAAATRDTSDQGTSIVRLGQSVKADIVIYVWVDSFGLTPDGATYQPFATARVKVIDVQAKSSRVWPESFEGHPVAVKPVVRANEVPKSAAAQSKAQDDLGAALGSTIARLFYDSESRESVTTLRTE